MQVKLELSFFNGHFTIVLVCKYLKYLRLCPWLFKWPEYEEEQNYHEDDQQDAYDNQGFLTSNVGLWTRESRYYYASAMYELMYVVDCEINYLCNMNHVIQDCKTLWLVINNDCDIRLLCLATTLSWDCDE